MNNHVMHFDGIEEEPLDIILSPFGRFFRAEAAGGIVLIACTLIALIWANSPWKESYHHFWHTTLTIGFPGFQLSKSLSHWINDGLMVIFFFMVGLEIKREVLVGELSDVKHALLPISGAVGGMVVPAGIFALFNLNSGGLGGWGIPMATDIAFALGILALFGERIPVQLKVFLAALAIIDDIGAVLVIALFYTPQVSLFYLGGGLALLAVLAVLNKLGARRTITYTLFGILIWLCFLKSGVHATVAGVLLAMVVPARTKASGEDFFVHTSKLLTAFREARARGDNVLSNEEQAETMVAMEDALQLAQTPLQRMEHALVPWVAFVVMPIFALANAGIELHPDTFMASVTHPVTLGVIGGLVVGKQVGIFMFSWAMVRIGWAEKPSCISWCHLHGASIVAGIGFTMSLFINNLAYTDPVFLEGAKIAILIASLVCAGWGWHRLLQSCERSECTLPPEDMPDDESDD